MNKPHCKRLLEYLLSPHLLLGLSLKFLHTQSKKEVLALR